MGQCVCVCECVCVCVCVCVCARVRAHAFVVAVFIKLNEACKEISVRETGTVVSETKHVFPVLF